MRLHFKVLPLLVLLSNVAAAQIYPVQGSATLIPPYAVRLSDYATSTSERIVLNTLLADVTKAELHVRFRLSIVGQNVKIETKPEYIGTPVTLQGGVPLRLTNTELAEYFDVNHLNFSGISKSEFLRTGFLPEGFYQFCFEVYEYGRSVKISSSICAPAWLVLNDPPIVNLPRNGEKLKPLTPQNVVFQWTPRHTGSPNAAFITEYDIKVVEVWPSNRNPNDAILTQPPIYETTTHGTTFVYGPDATQLELGRTYAFRVQARATAGAEQLDLFKNNGYSETVSFVYGDACDAPTNILADAAPTRVTLNWDASPSQTGYTVQYRLKGQREWYPARCPIPNAQLNDLQPNTTYEYQVMATCGTFESNYGDIATVTTPSLPEKGYSCGAPIGTINLDPTQLIPVLREGDVIKAGDFDVTATKTSGGNGVFSGEGTVRMPFFANAKARVKFDGITVARDVNGDKRMMKGEMTVIGPAIVPQNVMDAMDQLSEVMKIADSALNVARQFVTPKPDPNDFAADEVVNVPGIRSGYYDVATKKIIVVDNSGKQQSLSPGKNYAIKDGTGGGAIVNSQGGMVKVTAEQMDKILNRKYDPNLKFANAADSRYGIDIQNVDALKKNYEQLNGTYMVPFKAVAVGSADLVSATLIVKNTDLNKIKFDQDGKAVDATVTGESVALKINAKTKGDNAPVFARTVDERTKQESIVGKLNVAGYITENLKLHIVPVNGMKVQTKAVDIEKQLNAIYNPAVVDWKVAIETELKVEGLATPFDNGRSGALSTYTGDMKTVINSFLKNTKLESDNYYLFLVPKGTNTDESGYMPRSKQCGFIFMDAQSPIPDAQLVRTMAHELGHGAFTLEHTFAQYALTQGTTDNLMDYGTGTTLWKYQWDVVHNPRVVLGVFEGDEAGASKDYTNSILQAVHNANSKNLKTLDLGLFSGSSSSTSNFEIDKIKFGLMSINVPQNPASYGQPLIINPSETYKDYLKSLNGKNGDFVKYTFHAGGNSDRSIPKVATPGKTILEVTVNKADEQKLIDYLFKAVPPCTSFCCKVCGRDLKLDVARLQKIFSNNNNINQTHVDLFSKALLAGNFNTCRRQAHFFAQCKVESGNFNLFKERTDYTIARFFEVFSGNVNIGRFYESTFWKNNEHKKYFYINVFEKLGKKEENRTHKLKDTLSYTRAKETIYIPLTFSADTSGRHKKVVYTQQEKDDAAQNLFSLIYANGVGTGNGSPESKDGFKYLGRGPIQITGKTTYIEVADKASRLAGEKFNWSINYEEVASSDKGKVFSAVGFFLWKFKEDLTLLDSDNVFPVSVKVNGCKEWDKSGKCTAVNATEERENAYKSLMDNVFGACN